MEVKMGINLTDLGDWMSETFRDYASQTCNDKRLRLLINHYGICRVTHGKDVIYQGSQLTHAIAAWDSAK